MNASLTLNFKLRQIDFEGYILELNFSVLFYLKFSLDKSKFKNPFCITKNKLKFIVD